MRVLIVSADLPPDTWSGIGVAVAHAARALAERGCVVDVLAPAERCGRSAIAGANLHRLDRKRFPAALQRPDCLHLHSLGMAELGRHLRLRWDVPLAYTAHSLLEQELRGVIGAETWMKRQLRMFEEADHVFFLSIAEREEALSRSPSLQRRGSVLPNGLPPAPTFERSATREPMLLFAGRFSRNKGIDIAIATMSALLDRRADMRCVMAGGHAPHNECNDELRALDARHPGRVSLPGWVAPDAMDRLFRSASLMLAPSRYEPFGMAVLEAMQRGCPVLGAASSLLGQASGAVALTTHKVSDWVNGAEALLSNTARLRRLSADGPACVDRNFSIAHHARQLHERLSALVTERHGVAHVA